MALDQPFRRYLIFFENFSFAGCLKKLNILTTKKQQFAGLVAYGKN